MAESQAAPAPGPVVLPPRSALGTARAAAGRVLVERAELRIEEEPFLNVLALRRSRRSSAANVLEAVLGARGLAAPGGVGTLSGDRGFACARIEPSAWWVTSNEPIPDPTPDPAWLVTDLSHRLAALRLHGARARDILAAGCNMDVTGTGRCVRTLFAETAPVTLQQWSDADYRLLVDVSLAPFAADWLADAAQGDGT